MSKIYNFIYDRLSDLADLFMLFANWQLALVITAIAILIWVLK